MLIKQMGMRKLEAFVLRNTLMGFKPSQSCLVRKMFWLPTWKTGVGLEAGRQSGLLLWARFQTMVALSGVAEMR